MLKYYLKNEGKMPQQTPFHTSNQNNKEISFNKKPFWESVALEKYYITKLKRHTLIVPISFTISLLVHADNRLVKTIKQHTINNFLLLRHSFRWSRDKYW